MILLDDGAEQLGFKFNDKSGTLLYVEEGPFKGWLCRRHPDGFYVTMRIATPQDLETIFRQKCRFN